MAVYQHASGPASQSWSRPVGVTNRKNAYLSPAARRFVEILKATAREIAGKKR